MDQSKIKEKEMEQRLWELDKVKEVMVGGETNIDDEVIASIAGAAAHEVEGVASMGPTSIRRSLSKAVGRSDKKSEGVAVEAGKKEAIIDLTINVIYGFNIPNIVIDVRKTVATRFLEMLGMVAKEVNITVSGIEFPERMPGKLE